MFSFFLEGALGSVLAPPSDETARLLAFLDRSQEESALLQLQASQDSATGLELDIEGSSKEGLRPIHIAVEKGFGAVLMELLRMKADLESRKCFLTCILLTVHTRVTVFRFSKKNAAAQTLGFMGTSRV